MDSREDQQQLLCDLQGSVNYWKDHINQKLKENLENPNHSPQSVTLQQVIIFTLSKLEILLKNHKELALAAIDRNIDETIVHDKVAYKNLFKLIRLSYQTFQEIEEIHNTYKEDAKLFDKITMRAAEAMLTILAILFVSVIALYIASIVTTLTAMPMFYALAAGLGALIISMAIGIFSEKHAYYLKNNKAPKEMRPSSPEFYNNQLLVNTSNFEQDAKAKLLGSYVKLYITKDKLHLHKITEDTYTDQDYDMTDAAINQTAKLPLTNIEGRIHYVTLSSKRNPQVKKIMYRVKNDKIRYVFTKKQLSSDKEILDSILQKATNIHGYKCKQRFFNNAINTMLVDPSLSEDPENQKVTDFLETVGIY